MNTETEVRKRLKPLSTLRASAQRMTARTVKDRKFKIGENWQGEAWDLFDLVGEYHFLTTTVADRVGGAVLFVGKRSDDGDSEEPFPVDAGERADVLHFLAPTAVERTQLLTRAAINLSVAGEGWFVGVPKVLTPGDAVQEEAAEEKEDVFTRPAINPLQVPGASEDDLLDLNWFFLSNEEVRTKETGVTLDLPGGTVEEVDADRLFLIRLHRPHPRRYRSADSPTKSSLPVLRELVGLTQHVSAQIDSRLAGAGLFAVAQSILDAMKSDDPESTGEDELLESLMDAMITPISDRSNASALVPLLVGVPDNTDRPVEDLFHHQTFSAPLDAEARNLRDEAIRRLALGLDAPPELLLGMGSMNHWGAWLVKEETISSHVEPPLALICDALTREFLWPVLEEANFSEEEAREYVIWYSVRHLIARPNRTGEAITLHGSNVISDEALRREAGFNDDDSPDSDQAERVSPRAQAIEMALTMIQQAPSLATDPGIPMLVDQIEQAISGGTFDEEPEGDLAPVDEEPEGEEDEPDNTGGPPDTDEDEADVGEEPVAGTESVTLYPDVEGFQRELTRATVPRGGITLEQVAGARIPEGMDEDSMEVALQRVREALK